MLPSMYSPMESEVFPPDVCYAGETNSPSPTTWGKAANESQDTENDSDVDAAEDALKISALDDNEFVPEDSLEGAVGGILPDLCNTGSRTLSSLTLEDKNEEQSASQMPNFETHDMESSNIKENTHNKDDSLKATDSSSFALQKCDTDIDLSLKNMCKNEHSDFLLRNFEEKSFNNKNINLLPCETGNLETKLKNIVDTKDCSSSQRSETRMSVCDTYGALALDKREQEQSISVEKLGLDLVRKNVVHSSHPSYHEWKCSAVIPSYLLSPVSLHSHGTSLGYDFSPPLILSGSPSRDLSGDRNASSEDEHIKKAKRFGLIRHLPCGVFDGSTKTRECVICMIDFSVGDRVRYLPCMHTYHTDCIDDWLMRSFTCPSCLEPVDAALLSTYETT